MPPGLSVQAPYTQQGIRTEHLLAYWPLALCSARAHGAIPTCFSIECEEGEEDHGGPHGGVAHSGRMEVQLSGRMAQRAFGLSSSAITAPLPRSQVAVAQQLCKHRITASQQSCSGSSSSANTAPLPRSQVAVAQQLCKHRITASQPNCRCSQRHCPRAR